METRTLQGLLLNTRACCGHIVWYLPRASGMSLAAVDKEVDAGPLVQVPDLSSEDHPKCSLLLPMRCLRTGSYRLRSTLSPTETGDYKAWFKPVSD